MESNRNHKSAALLGFSVMESAQSKRENNSQLNCYFTLYYIVTAVLLFYLLPLLYWTWETKFLS